jgi:hypothetical protein
MTSATRDAQTQTDSEMHAGAVKHLIEQLIFSGDVRALAENYDQLNQHIKDALAVRGGDANMGAKTVVDAIFAPILGGRATLQAHPYPWAATGAMNVPVYLDASGAAQVALVWNKRRDKALCYRTCEGFLHPKPGKGGEHGTTNYLDQDTKEVAVYAQKDSVTPVVDAYKNTQASKQEQEIITARLNDVAAWAEHCQQNAISDSEFLEGCYDIARKHLKNPEFDSDFEDGAKRELREEISLDISKSDIKEIHHFAQTGGYLTANCWFWMPVAKGASDAPALVIGDEAEIGQANWCDVSKFEVSLNEAVGEEPQTLFRVTYQKDEHSAAIKVHDYGGDNRYAIAIGLGLKAARDNQVVEALAASGVPTVVANNRFNQCLQSAGLGGVSSVKALEIYIVNRLAEFGQENLQANYSENFGAFPLNQWADSLADQQVNIFQRGKITQEDSLVALGHLGKDAHGYVSRLLKSIPVLVGHQSTPVSERSSEGLLAALESGFSGRCEVAPK